MKSALLLILLLLASAGCISQPGITASYDCLSRIVNKDSRTLFVLEIKKDDRQKSYFSYKTAQGKVHITASSPVDLTRGAYDFLYNTCNSIVSWTGNRIVIPSPLPQISKSLTSPFPLRYYMNVVTNGYSTPYWDWQRWEKEIDWMAVHGINMPLIPAAHEAILDRVFEKLGFTQAERQEYFCGPAHLPWNRMGNINGFDGPLSNEYMKKQLKLSHQMLNRLSELGMHPIIPAFAGFVPKSAIRIYPNEKLRELSWGGFNAKNHAWLLDPNSELFHTIGKMYIQEWEKEFGKAEYYLADSFNEMEPPLSKDSLKALSELADYGLAVYNSIKDANPNATWVMQGWTFPYHRDKNGKLFWSPAMLKALLSKTPDDKVLLLDITNEYSRAWWNCEPSWKMFDGFFGKQWIFGYIPVMGGHVPYNGRLDIYASMSIEALNYENKKNLVGFGFAPEGIENNDIIYELLADMAWQTQPIDLNTWIEHYCKSRYGGYPEKMKTAYEYLLKSAYGNFTDDAIYQYQFGPISKRKASVCKSPEFAKGVEAFLACRDKLKNSELYKYDLIEVTCQYLGLKADEMIIKFKNESNETDYALLDSALNLLNNIDRLYESHSTHKLENWVSLARSWGSTEKESNYYEANAKRLITYWGGDTREITDYSARSWSGLIRDYYLPRWELFYNAKQRNEKFDLLAWEDKWVTSPGVSEIEPFNDPLQAAIDLFTKNKSEQ
jgi:alpha-N-acetylglucosaminidase